MVARPVPLLLASPRTTAATAVSPIPMRLTQVLHQGPRLPTARTRAVARRRSRMALPVPPTPPIAVRLLARRRLLLLNLPTEARLPTAPILDVRRPLLPPHIRRPTTTGLRIAVREATAGRQDLTPEPALILRARPTITRTVAPAHSLADAAVAASLVAAGLLAADIALAALVVADALVKSLSAILNRKKNEKLSYHIKCIVPDGCVDCLCAGLHRCTEV